MAATSLPQRLLDAADAIEELNAMQGLPATAPVSPKYLRWEAERITTEVPQ